MRRINWLLLAIILLAALLRFYKLGQNPPSLEWDETADGYNAYSILKTGRDEYGLKFPLYFRSFDDYKPPVYIYTVVPSVAIFGLNDFAVRFPSAFLGTLGILFTYLMVYELFKKKEIAYLSAFFLAISPWHLQFSRVALETNITITFSTLGTWAFLKAINYANFTRRTLFLTITALSFGINLFVYHTARVFIPLFSIVLLTLFTKNLIKNFKALIIPSIITIIFILTLVPIVFSVAGQERYEGTAIFQDHSPYFQALEQLQEDKKHGLVVIGKIIHNRRVVYIPIIIRNYLSHFNPTFLFFAPDTDRHHAPQMGLLYLWDVPFLISGFYFLFKKDFETKSKLIIGAWFLLGPVASSLTKGAPHSLRSDTLLPTFQIFVALGAYFLYKNIRFKKLFVFLVSILLLCNFAFYLHQYYVHMPHDYSEAWLFGRKEAALYSNSVKNNYDKVIVSTSVDQGFEFWLYFLKYDPATYLKEGGTASGGYLEDRNHFDKFQFKPIDFQKQKNQGRTLFVGTPDDFKSSVKILKEIDYLNGKPSIYIVDGTKN